MGARKRIWWRAHTSNIHPHRPHRLDVVRDSDPSNASRDDVKTQKRGPSVGRSVAAPVDAAAVDARDATTRRRDARAASTAMVRFATARALAMAVALAIAATRVDDARATTATPRVSSQDATRFGTTPTGRTGSASGTFAATATTSARMVVFGGRELATGRDANDVWEYDLRWNASAGIYDGMWTRLHEGGTGGGGKPRGRSGASACALRGNLYVFGGYGGGGGDFDDLWVFNRAAGRWSAISPVGGTRPPRRSGAATTTPHGEQGAACLVFGGNGMNDVWEFNIDTNAWSLVRDNTATTSAGGATLAPRVVVVASTLLAAAFAM